MTGVPGRSRIIVNYPLSRPDPQGWQGRRGSSTPAPRPATPSDTSGPAWSTAPNLFKSSRSRPSGKFEDASRPFRPSVSDFSRA